MAKKRPEYRQRIPHEHKGIQVNFCKRPGCPNFGIPAEVNIKGLKLPPVIDLATGRRHRDNYKLSDNKLVCHGHNCKAEMPIKSNKGIFEEYARMSEYLSLQAATEATCPDKNCTNHGIPVSAGTIHYYKDGRHKSGAIRYICRACSRNLSVNDNPAKGQNKRELNGIIFRLLVNKVPLQRICEVVQISMPSLYDKIDFFHKQCQLFAGHHEQRLRYLHIKRLQISVDRQDYMVNWSDTLDKRNVIIHALGSADNRTGFVFGIHLNVDAEAKKNEIEAAAKACGDYEKKPAFREYARYWLEPDFEESRTQQRLTGKGKKKLLDSIAESYAEAELREDIESFEQMTA